MTSDSAQVLLELAERLVSVPHPGIPIAMPRVRLLAGAVPDTLPFALPRPPQARLLGSVVRPVDAGISADIVYTTRATPEAVVGGYDEQFAAQGWTPAPATGPLGWSGFQSTLAVPVYRYSQGETGPTVTVTVMVPVAGEYEVRVHVETVRPPQPQRPMLRGQSILPRVSSPHGVFMTPGSGNSSDDHAASTAFARTELSALELETHVAGQLAAAGWERREGGTNGALAWSSWSVPQPSGDPWEGLLYAVEEPLGARRWLHLRTNAPGRDGFLDRGGGDWIDMRPNRP